MAEIFANAAESEIPPVLKKNVAVGDLYDQNNQAEVDSQDRGWENETTELLYRAIETTGVRSDQHIPE